MYKYVELNNILLNNNWVQKIILKNGRYFGKNENKTTTFQSHGMQQTQCLERY